MSKVLHIKDGYFKLPDTSKDNLGCMLVLLGVYLQRQEIGLEDVNKLYDGMTEIEDFFNDDKLKCLLSCSFEDRQ